MANINLISGRRAESVRMTQVAKGLFVLMVGCGLLAMAIMAFMLGQQFVADGHIREEKDKLAKLKPIIEEIDAAKRDRNNLLPKLETLTQAQKRTKRWWDVMEGLKHAIPEETWLTKFSVDQPGDAPTLGISGVTTTQRRVGETMMLLSAQPEHFTRVDLRYTQQDPNSDNVVFELAAQLVSLEPPKPEGEGDAPKAK